MRLFTKCKNCFEKILFAAILIAAALTRAQPAQSADQQEGISQTQKSAFVGPEQSHRFKMISTIEYSGKGQNRSQAESFFTVTKKDARQRYGKLCDNIR